MEFILRTGSMVSRRRLRITTGSIAGVNAEKVYFQFNQPQATQEKQKCDRRRESSRFRRFQCSHLIYALSFMR